MVALPATLLLLTAVAALTFASAFLVAYALTPIGGARQRLQDLMNAARPDRVVTAPLGGDGGADITPASRPKGHSMVWVAGYHQPWAPALYRFAQIGLALVLGLSTWLAIGLVYGMPAGLIMAAVGYLAPGFWLGTRMKARHKLIQNGLPDALDLMVVCLEAGAGVDAAIVKAATELGIAYPALADELRMVSAETRAGETRIAALRHLADRTKVDDVRSLVAMLVQTDRFGTSISQALRTHADVSRTKRRQRAEERAAKIGVKLVFPLVFFMFPSLYVVVLGPLVIQFARVFASQGRP